MCLIPMFVEMYRRDTVLASATMRASLGAAALEAYEGAVNDIVHSCKLMWLCAALSVAFYVSHFPEVCSSRVPCTSHLYKR